MRRNSSRTSSGWRPCGRPSRSSCNRRTPSRPRRATISARHPCAGCRGLAGSHQRPGRGQCDALRTPSHARVEEQAFRRITLKVQLTATIEELFDTLYELEFGAPILFVEDLDIQSRIVRRQASDKAGANEFPADTAAGRIGRIARECLGKRSAQLPARIRHGRDRENVFGAPPLVQEPKEDVEVLGVCGFASSARTAGTTSRPRERARSCAARNSSQRSRDPGSQGPARGADRPTTSELRQGWHGRSASAGPSPHPMSWNRPERSAPQP